MRISRENSVKSLALSALIAAIYACLTMVLYAPSYGPIQLRFAEAMTVLPFVFPFARGGLFAGCLVANLLSPYGPIDVIFGSMATLIAAIWTGRIKNKWLCPLPPVICNAVIVGATIAYSQAGTSDAFSRLFLFHGVTVGIGELIVCYLLGMLLLHTLPKIDAVRHLIPDDKLALLDKNRQGKRNAQG